MKRTKTFVMKFLSVIALGALVLTSCTKDLEDRMDKVEGDITTIFKDLKALQEKLTEVEATIPTDAIAKIEALTLRVKALEDNGATDAELLAAKNELNDAIKAVPSVSATKDAKGNYVITIKKDGQPDQVLTAVGIESLSVVENDNNTTTVTVGDKTFTFPTTIVIPSNINAIHIATKAPFTVENLKSIDIVVTLDTNDDAQVELNANNFVITNAYDTRASIYTPTENVAVTKVTPITGAVNEFTVTISALKEAVAADYRLAIEQTTNTQRSQPFSLTVVAYQPIVKSAVFSPDAAYTDGMVLINTSVDNNTVAGTVVNSRHITYQNAANANIASDVKTFSVQGFEVLGATSAADALTKAGFNGIVGQFSAAADAAGITTFDNAVTALATDTDVKPYANVTISRLTDVNQCLQIGFTLPEYKSTVGTRYYLVIIDGTTIENKLIRQYVLVEVENDTKFNYAPATIAIETAAQRTVAVPNALDKTYFAATGLDALTTAVTAKLVDADGVEVSGTTVTVNAPQLTGDGYLTYSYTVNNPEEIAAGEYSVIVSNVYDASVGKKITIIHPITVTRPDVAIINPTTLGKGYSATGTLTAINAATLTSNFTFASVVKGSLANEGTAYKVFYRLYTETPGVSGAPATKIYLDGLDAAGAKTNYVIGATPSVSYGGAITEVGGTFLTANDATVKLAYDKSYKVEAYVVYASGFAKTVATSFVFKYELPAVINGFSTFANAGANSTTTFDLGTVTFADAKVINVSYVDKVTKPFYFTNGTGNFYLSTTDDKLSDNAYLTISDIAYSVKTVAYDADKMIGGASTGTYSFIGLGTNGDLTLDNASVTATATGIAKAKYVQVTTSVADVTGIKAGQTVTQPIEVSITDVWSRNSKIVMNVTIAPTPIP